jgi:hypothetical protein
MKTILRRGVRLPRSFRGTSKISAAFRICRSRWLHQFWSKDWVNKMALSEWRHSIAKATVLNLLLPKNLYVGDMAYRFLGAGLLTVGFIVLGQKVWVGH